MNLRSYMLQRSMSDIAPFSCEVVPINFRDTLAPNCACYSTAEGSALKAEVGADQRLSNREFE